MRLSLFSVFCALLVTWSSPSIVRADVYTIDPTQSELAVQLFKAGLGSAFAHDHVVRARKYTGQIVADPAAPDRASIAIEVEAASLVVDEPETRRKYGLPLSLSEEQRQDIQRTMASEEQLYVHRYPLLRFRSTQVKPEGNGRYTVTGNLEIRGVEQPVTISTEVQVDNRRLHGRGVCRFLQSSFGYAPYRALFGAVQNKDEVVLHVNIVAVRQ
ncbi:MAG TPA: YceI family protein [Methylomirabilota bacterium]|nr:YceI family protein [Methylomirabilota bacterium]